MQIQFAKVIAYSFGSRTYNLLTCLVKTHNIFQPASGCTAPLDPLGHQERMESPDWMVRAVKMANLVRMDWTSVLRTNPPSLASFALQVHLGLEAPREIPALVDRKDHLAILDFLAATASQDRRE